MLCALVPALPASAAPNFSGGRGTESNPYQITTLADLEALRDHVNSKNDCKGQYFKLTTDIDMQKKSSEGEDGGTNGEPTQWEEPIGDWSTEKFNGAFDGGGHTISGLYVSLYTDSVGLFGYIGSSGTIKNLTVSGSVAGGSRVGGIAVSNRGLITNCTNECTVSGSSYYVAGIVADNDGGRVEHCHNNGAVGGSGYEMGGIVGINTGGSIEYCDNQGTINSSRDNDGKIGGICGESYDGGSIKNCDNNGAVNGTGDNIGGIVGQSRSGSIENCNNSGTVTGSSDNIGGIAGDSSGGNIENCHNSGAVSYTGSYKNNIGGIAGQNQDCSIKSCDNTGTVNGGSAFCVGGISGSSLNSGIENCYNTGTIGSGNEEVGGISGRTSNTTGSNNGSIIKNCYNTGAVNGTGSRIGGIAGESFGDTLTDSSIVENCYNVGAVSSAGSYIGGVVGQIIDIVGDKIRNSYYLDTCGAGGEGTQKTETGFRSGEITRLLQNGQSAQVWGQKLGDGADPYPVLTSDASKKVLKVTFSALGSANYDVRYANPNGTVTLPANPSDDTRAFERWSLTQDVSGETFDAKTPVKSDMTVYAVGQYKFGGDIDITLSDTYGYEAPITADLNDYIKYANEGITSEDKFAYSIASDENDTKATIEDGNTLSVPAGLSAGDYVITVTAHENEPQHSLMSVESYGTEDVTLTVKVSIAKAASSVTVEPTAADLTYSEAAQALVIAGEAEGGEMQYSTDGETYSPDIPTGTDADTYTVWYKVVGDGNHNDTEPQSVEVTIAKSEPTATVTSKALSYTGSAQELVTGTVTGGTLVYSMNKDGDYEETIPTAADAGNYTVWYKVIGDDNHKDTEPQSVTATIVRGAIEASVSGKSLSYTGGEQELVTGTVTGGTLMYSMSKDGEYEAKVPTAVNAGSYTIWYKVIGDDNHTDTEPQSVTASIAKIYPETTVTSKDLSYTGREQALVSGTVKGGTLVYSMNKDGEYEAKVPTAVNAGSYTVWYKVIGDANHNNTEPRSIDVTIIKVTATASVKANELVYKDREQYLVTGKTSDGTLLYSTSENGEYSEKIPTGKDVGDYTVWYKVIADDNHIDSEPQSITVSIRNIVGISIEKEPTNTTIIEGMPFDASGLKVMADCGDGDTFEARGYTLSGYDTSKVGEQTVTVTYAGKTAEFKITVEAKSMTSIELTHTPDKLTYYTGDKLDMTGMVITAFYNNNTSEFINNADCTVSGSTDTTGEQTVTVTYNGQTVKFTVTVLERPVQTQTVETPLIETADFYGGKRVIISCATDGANIYYTTDGSNPTAASNKYAAPIEFTESAEIKAVAVKSGMTDSAVSNKSVTVEKVAAPVASVTGEVEVGTSVKLLSTTPEAEIYYAIGDSVDEDNYKKYTGEIVITGSMKIRAIAAKRGYAMSDAVTFEYTVAPPEETSETNRALLDAGETMCKEGKTCYLPAYIYSESAIKDFRYTLSFDSDKFEYVGFEAGEDVPASAVSITTNENSVTVRGTVDGLTAAEACVLVFKTKSGVEVDDYLLPVEDIEINTVDDSLTDIWYLDGLISVIPADTSITASAFLSDAEDNLIEYAEDVKGDLTAWILAQTAEEMPEGEETIGCNLILAFYDVNGALVKVTTTEAEISGEMDFFEVPITILENTEIGDVKLMVWDNAGTMKPLMEDTPVIY